MHHSFIDKYSHINSIIHKLDPRIKIVVLILFILFVVTTPPVYSFNFIVYFLFITLITLISKIPLMYMFKRALVVIPFVLIMALSMLFYGKADGVIITTIVTKSLLSVMAMILLSATSKFSVLLKGFEKLYVPKIIVMLVSFMYRYIYILLDEIMHMQRARDSRYFGGHYFRQIKVFAHLVGSFFIRVYERAERVHKAMLARGFSGEIKTIEKFSIKAGDIIIGFLFCAILFVIKLNVVIP